MRSNSVWTLFICACFALLFVYGGISGCGGSQSSVQADSRPPPSSENPKDVDGDEIFDDVDNCPNIANENQADIDEDDIGDVCDPDIDGDGVLNGDDAFPNDPNESTDTDDDGTGDNVDTDNDDDGILDDVDNCPLVANADQTDTDGDGVGDACDPPTISDEFVSDNSDWEKQIQVPGSITFGVNNASAQDGKVVKVLITGNPALGPDDKVGPTFANQIATDDPLSFGTYRFRVKTAKCLADDEEIVSGFFVYSNDGSDTNGNGLDDNNEIDFEFTCSMPKQIQMTVWTDYTDDSHFRKVSRNVDAATGQYEQTEPGHEDEWGFGPIPLEGTVAGLADADFDETNNFYEMGFDWHSDQVRFFIVIDGNEITLWDFTDSSFIPQNPASFMMNIWHTTPQWDGSGDGDYPKNDVFIMADWFKYWAE